MGSQDSARYLRPLLGLELCDISIDGCITKAPCGGEKAGKARWIEANEVSNAPQSLMRMLPRHCLGCSQSRLAACGPGAGGERGPQRGEGAQTTGYRFALPAS